MSTRVVLQITAIVMMVGCAGCSGVTPVMPRSVAPPPSSGPTSGPLAIRRIDLLFVDGRAETTVPRNSRLVVKAAVQFDGNGQFRGAWIVDGRVVGLMSRMVTYGQTVNLETGSETILPTFEPGPHDVRIRIDEPATALPMPVIRYWVTGNE